MTQFEMTLIIMAAQDVYMDRARIPEFEALLEKHEEARRVVLAAAHFGILRGCTLKGIV
jgi:lauroyl/myristoyl acyltransferase